MAQASSYTLSDLGTLGGTNSFAYGINATGQVVGYSDMPGNTDFHAFLYSGGVMSDLLGDLGGTHSIASDINAAGQVVGRFGTATSYHAFLYSGGGMTDLGTLGGTTSYATGINATGQVVGFSTVSGDTATHAFLKNSGGGMIDLHTFAPVGVTDSYAYGINAAGQVVGYLAIPDPAFFTTAFHAFLYSDGVMTDLGTLGGRNSYAWDINDTGQIVGQSNLLNNNQRTHAFLKNSGEVMSDLGTLPGGKNSFAYAINATGQIVGRSNPFDNLSTHAILYSGGVMTDLGTLGGLDSFAYAINATGQIAGHSDVASLHAFLANPLFVPLSVPEPTSAVLAAFAILLLAPRARRRHDARRWLARRSPCARASLPFSSP